MCRPAARTLPDTSGPSGSATVNRAVWVIGRDRGARLHGHGQFGHCVPPRQIAVGQIANLRHPYASSKPKWSRRDRTRTSATDTACFRRDCLLVALMVNPAGCCTAAGTSIH